MRIADRARGFDVVLDLCVQHLRPRQTDKGRHRRDADRNHRIGEARAEEGGERDGEDEERTSEERVRDAHEEPVEEPADIARDEADRYAAGKRDADRDDAGEKGGSRSEDHPREHVAADLVGAEPMLERRRLAYSGPAGRDRLVGRDERRRDCDQNEEQHDDGTDHGTAPLDEAPNRAPPGLGVGWRDCRRRRYADRGHARNLGLTRKYVMSAKRLRTIYAVAVQRTTPCTTA